MPDPDATDLVAQLTTVADNLHAIADAANRIHFTLLDAGLLTPVVSPSFEVEAEGFVRGIDDAPA